MMTECTALVYFVHDCETRSAVCVLQHLVQPLNPHAVAAHSVAHPMTYSCAPTRANVPCDA
jgi:hypothetical protein